MTQEPSLQRSLRSLTGRLVVMQTPRWISVPQRSHGNGRVFFSITMIMRLIDCVQLPRNGRFSYESLGML